MKILQWLFSSFFRTIGRTIAILVMGGLLYYILSINGIGISDLFFDKVKATDFSSGYTDAYYSNSGRTNILTTHGAPTNDYYGYEYTYSDGINRYMVSYYNNFYFKTNITTSSQTNVMYIPVYMVSLSGTEVHYSLSAYIHDTRDNKYYSCERISYASNTEVYSTLKCPFRKGAVIDKIETYAVFENQNGLNIASYYLNRYYTLEYEDNVQAIIDNQNQNNQQIIEQQQNNTQQIIEQQQNTTQQMLDSNTTQADNTGKDFITNFSNNTHGLTGIITAPLNAIQSLSSATCTPLILPLPFTDNKTLTLPCMNTIYSQYFGAFYTMYQGIILGLISYWVCVRIFGLAKGFKDPEDDKIEVVDL